MDAQNVGKTIAELRQKNGMTQGELAEKLGISNKTVSKWECGQGYPDITLFPILAELFGVSVDYLMMGEERGIAVAGNIVLDIVKSIAVYPERGMLVNIADITRSVGGCAPNVAIDLAKLDPRLPVSVLGKVGSDENGRFIVSQMQKYGIRIEGISYSAESPTSFTDVMSIPSGERTFFHKSGANAEFAPSDVDIAALHCNLLHIGYILLLDCFDAEDKQYGTVMARFLHDVQKAGIKTSVDLVSDSTGEFAKKVIPVLRYCHYLIINELECCRIWGLDARRQDGTLNVENVRTAMEKCIEAGVGEYVVVHCQEACFSLDRKGRFESVASLHVPKSDIKGSVGAGDAFCAGCLYSIYRHESAKQMLEFATAAAASSLLEVNSVDGMRPRNEVLKLIDKYGRRSL